MVTFIMGDLYVYITNLHSFLSPSSSLPLTFPSSQQFKPCFPLHWLKSNASSPDPLNGLHLFTSLPGLRKCLDREFTNNDSERSWKRVEGRGAEQLGGKKNQELGLRSFCLTEECFDPICLDLTAAFMFPVTHSPVAIPVAPILHQMLQTVVQGISVFPAQL